MRTAPLLLMAMIALPCAATRAACPETPPFVSDATIGFESGSSSLRPNDVRDIRDMAARVATRRISQICVYGSAGKAEGGNALALDRAEAVADELRAAGVPTYQIDVVASSGSGGFLGALAGGGSNVEIVLEP